MRNSVIGACVVGLGVAMGFGGAVEPAWAQPCQVAWQDGFEASALGGEVLTTAVWDDGTGAALYAGGRFRYADDLRVNGVAKRVGEDWVGLGSGPSSSEGGHVLALLPWDRQGQRGLYAVGNFGFAASGAAGVRALLSRWDGVQWTSVEGDFFGVPTSPPSGSLALRVYSAIVVPEGTSLPGGIYVFGRFGLTADTAGTTLAHWNGQVWSTYALPAEFNTSSVEYFGTTLSMAFGSFGGAPRLFVPATDRTSGQERGAVLAWDGTAWSTIARAETPGFWAGVYTLAVFGSGANDRLWIGGRFQSINGVGARGLASWDGTTFAPVDAGSLAISECLALIPRTVGTEQRLFAAVSPLTTSSSFGLAEVRANVLETATSRGIFRPWDLRVDPEGRLVVAGGSIDTGDSLGGQSIAYLVGREFAAMHPSGRGTLVSRFDRLRVIDDGAGEMLLLHGSFGLLQLDNARWRILLNTSSLMGQNNVSGAAGVVGFPDSQGPRLILGGKMAYGPDTCATPYTSTKLTTCLAVRGCQPRAIAVEYEYTGNPGSLSSRFVAALAVHNDGSGPQLFASGQFDASGLPAFTELARWNGATWVREFLPSTSSSAMAFASADLGSGSRLFAAARYFGFGAAVYSRIGQTWQSIGNDITTQSISFENSFRSLPVRTLLPWTSNPQTRGLYVVGDVRLPNTSTTTSVGVIRYDGSAWSIPGGGLADMTANDAVVWDDGSGEALYVVGTRRDASGRTSGVIRRWRGGGSWEDVLPGSLDASELNSAAVYDEGDGAALFVSGSIFAAGGFQSAGIAKLKGCAALPCRADVDRSGSVTIDDLLAYLDDFAKGYRRADLDDGSGQGRRDSGVTIEDLLYFLERFGAGC